MTRSASHVSRALAAWREANPQGLIGRLVELHQRDPERARWLAYYIEQYHADRTPPGEPWPYQWLMVDVAGWPVVRGPAKLRFFYPDMAPDQTLCLVCGGWGETPEEGLAERLERYGEMGLSLEDQLDEEGIGWGLGGGGGYNPGDPPYEVPCPSCSGSGRWGDDIPCGRCGGEGVVR